MQFLVWVSHSFRIEVSVSTTYLSDEAIKHTIVRWISTHYEAHLHTFENGYFNLYENML